MNKIFAAFLLIFSFCFLFNLTAKADGDLLNQIMITDGQFSIANNKLVQQKVKNLDAKLNMTEEQVQKVKLIGADSSKKVNAILFKVMDIHERKALIALKKRTVNNEEQQNNHKNLIRTTRAKMKAIREENMVKLEAILTAEQKAEFEKFKIELKTVTGSSSLLERSVRSKSEEEIIDK